MYVQSHVIRWSVHRKQAASQLAMLVINVMCPEHYLNTNTIKFLFVRGVGEGGRIARESPNCSMGRLISIICTLALL